MIDAFVLGDWRELVVRGFVGNEAAIGVNVTPIAE
jgi:hypothetical protein